jgi:D-arabinose 1-dehydrogenase-like Zn-dependent alcohol dehydrogenase
MYSPLKHWGAANGGRSVGVVGIGGLGQMGLRLAKTMGNTVVAISTSPAKQAAAMAAGANRFLVSSDPEAMAAAAQSLDLILNTVSAPHELSTYLGLLKRQVDCNQESFMLTVKSNWKNTI